MTRVLPVVCCVLAWGASEARSQTPLERISQIQKDLQIPAKKSAEKGGADDTPEDPATQPADKMAEGARELRFRERYEENALRGNLLGVLEEVRSQLATGNDETALQSLGQLRNGYPLPDAVTESLDKLRQQLQTARAAKEAEFAKAVDAACQRAAQAIPTAKEPKDLDATLRDLAQVGETSKINRYSAYGGGENRAAGKLQAAISFVNHWQDYLQALNRGNDNAVANVLRNLADSGNNNNQPPLIPRSEILARQPETEGENGPNHKRSAVARPQAQIDAAAVEIVQGIKQPGEISAALAKLVALRNEITAQPNYSFRYDSDLGVAISGLQDLEKSRVELQNGLATKLSLGGGRSESNAHPVIDAALLPLRIALVKEAMPRLLGAGNEKPGDNEGVDAYLQRLIDQAKGRQDWAAVVRGLELRRTLNLAASDSPGVGNAQETQAYRDFLAGLNLEQAGQYQQAAISYLTALRTGQQDLPAKLIGEHLDAIAKAHPADYNAGKDYVLTPPRPAYGDYPAGMPPGMYRRTMDPRFRDRPDGTSEPSAPEKVAVPAASPTPVGTPAPTLRPSSASPAPPPKAPVALPTAPGPVSPTLSEPAPFPVP